MFIRSLSFVLFISATILGNTYYIDYSGGSDAKPGTSKSEAWQKCPGMAGFAGAYSHSPGDVFVFKGGVVWPAASLPLTIAYSGSSGNTDTYTTDHAWYSGTAWTQPAMDGQLSGRTIVSGSDKGYFKINDIRFVNAGSLSANGFKGVELSDCDNVELCNNTFAPESWGCLYLWTSKPKNFNNYLIHHNDISKCAFGIRIVPSGASSIINNVQIYNNSLHDFHSQLSGEVHGDGIQHYCSPDVAASYDRYINGFKIFNNSFTGDFTQVAGSSGAMTALIYLSGASKGVEIYNNLFAPFTSGTQTPNFFESFISLRDNPNRGGFHKIYNNTFVTQVPAGQAAALIEDDSRLPSPNLNVKNNIFSGFQWPFDIRSVSDTFDCNDVHFTKNVGKWAGSWVETFSDWQRLGNDIHGISADPQFVSSTDFHLRPGSPCEDRGAILGEPYTIDRDGENRPQGPTYDLGAFEIPQQTTAIQGKPADFIPASPGLRAPLPGDRTGMFDITGRLVGTGKNSLVAHPRLLVIVPEGKHAYIRPEVKR
jgi:hypothetical protein